MTLRNGAAIPTQTSHAVPAPELPGKQEAKPQGPRPKDMPLSSGPHRGDKEAKDATLSPARRAPRGG